MDTDKLPDRVPASEIPDDFISGISPEDTAEYSPFNTDLDEKYPIRSVISASDRKTILSGVDRMAWANRFSQSPARNGEAEMLMGEILSAAIRADQWVDIPMRKDEDLDADISIPDGGSTKFSGMFGEHKLEFERASKILEKIGMVSVVKDDDAHDWIKPKEPLIRYYQTRFLPDPEQLI